MNQFITQIKDLLANVPEMMPWDFVEYLSETPDVLVVDVRESAEYRRMHIEGSLNIPRGILESACEWNYEETEPRLARSRDQAVVLVCRSGHRSRVAGWSLQILGFQNVYSLKTGLRGWNDYEQPLVDITGELVDMDAADHFFTAKLRDDQMHPVLGKRPL